MNVPGTARRRIRLAMVGGGEGSFIGAAHRVAARLDDQFELVAGAFSSEPTRALASGAALGLPSDRCYGGYEQMVAREAQREGGAEVVAIVTPNHLHARVATACLAHGLDVICEKPLAVSLAEADALVQLSVKHRRLFTVTYTYAGYPAIRHARELVASGALGELRVVQVEYAQDWLATDVEQTGHKQAGWRTDPAQAGPAGALGDIGTHAFHLLGYVSGLAVEEICAEVHTFVPGRQLDDHVQAMLRLQGGARGMLWASQVACGEHNALRLRLYGSRASIRFDQEVPDTLWFAPLGEPAQCLRRGALNSQSAAAATRLPPGHPEGWYEALAQLYRDFAELWHARAEARIPPPWALTTPQLHDGRQGLAFVEAVLRSHGAGQRWVSLQ